MRHSRAERQSRAAKNLDARILGAYAAPDPSFRISDAPLEDDARGVKLVLRAATKIPRPFAQVGAILYQRGIR